jgi:hypothetical protein
MARPPWLIPMENLKVAESSMGYVMSIYCIEEGVAKRKFKALFAPAPRERAPVPRLTIQPDRSGTLPAYTSCESMISGF